MGNIETMSVNAIRVLAADAVQKAKSGHPGLPHGCPAVAYELCGQLISTTIRRIRSGRTVTGCISFPADMVPHCYTLFFIRYGYGNLDSKEDLENFRQWGS